MYDSRIGRRWEIDPLTYPWQSPYSTFNNNSILFADPLGLRGDDKAKKKGDRPKFGDKKRWEFYMKHRSDFSQKSWQGYSFNFGGNGEKKHTLSNPPIHKPFVTGEFMRIMNRVASSMGTASGYLGIINGSTEFKIIPSYRNGKPYFKDYLFQNGEHVGRELAFRNYKFAKGIVITGNTLNWIGIGTDVFGVGNYFAGKNPNDNHVVHPAKAGLNLGFSILGKYGGPFGLGVSTGYFLLDQIEMPSGCGTCPVFNKFVTRQDNLKPKLR